ncbi:MAG: glycosidase, partial [Planctomycetes bacterium]|nr:glycosidase [Planctomycetota bacterium]
EDRKGFSSIYVARSANGIADWKISPEPILRYGEPEMRYERLGCEDARVTYIEEDDEYYITYVAYSGNGPAVALARTEDFEEAERVGLILSPSNKDAVMFPRKINGHYIVLHRPEAGQIEHIWSAQSPDLIHWGMPHCVLPERGGPWWDGVKVGAGPPPVLTDDGWLLIYHGVKMFGGSMVYRVGMALLDREEPHHALARTPGWVFAPEAEYEVRGVLPNVVFPCGAFKRGDELWMYYGAADTSICLARASLADIPLAMRTGE